jgi:hypothetical protein
MPILLVVSTAQRIIIAIKESPRGQGVGPGLVREVLRLAGG